MKRGGQVLAGVLDDFSQVRKAMSEMNNAAGAADAEMEVVEQSWEYKVNRLKETWVGVAQKVVDRDAIGDFVDALTSLSEGLGAFIERCANVPTVITAIGTAFATFKTIGKMDFSFGAMKDFVTNVPMKFDAINEKITEYNDIVKVSQAEQAKYTAGLQMGSGALNQYLISLNGAPATMRGFIAYLAQMEVKAIATSVAMNLLKMAIMAGVTIIASYAVSAIMKQVHAQEEARKSAVELANTYKDDTDSLNDYIAKYQEASEKIREGNLSESELASTKSELSTIQQELNDKYGDEFEHLNLVNGKYEEQIGLLNQISKSKAEDIYQKNKSQYAKAKKYLENSTPISFNSAFSDPAIKEFIDSYDSEFVHAYKNQDSQGVDLGTYNIAITATMENADDVFKQFYTDLEAYGKTHNVDVSKILTSIANQRNKLAKDDKLADYKAIRDEYVQALIVRDDSLSTPYEEGLEAVKKYNEALANKDGFEEAKTNLDAIKDKISKMTFDDAQIKTQFDHLWDDIDHSAEKSFNLDKAFESALDKNNIKQAVDSQIKVLEFELKKEKSQFDKLGVDANKSIFGNIDLNDEDRKLEWTTENVKKYGDAIASWGENAEDYLGSYSTVDGRSEEFDGVEVAFTPMLKTDSGMEYLDSTTVHNYINSIMQKANGNIDKAYELDATGLDINGKHIQGLIADIGETAITTGEAMHYLGSTGSIADLENELRNLKEDTSQAGSTLEWYLNRLTSFNLKDIDFANGLDSLPKEARYTFEALLRYLGYTEDDIDLVKDKLKELGIIASDTANALSQTGDVDFNLKGFNETLSGLKSLASAYDSWLQQTEEGVKIQIDSTEIESLRETFSNLGLDEEFDQFQLVAGNSASTLEQIKAAFNNLGTTYVNNSGLLKQLTTDNADYIKSQLEGIGVTNADVIVQQELEKQMLAVEEAEVRKEIAEMQAAGATYEEIGANEMLQQAHMKTRLAILETAMAEEVFENSGLDFSAKIAKLEELASAYLGVAQAEKLGLGDAYKNATEKYSRIPGLSDAERAKAIAQDTTKALGGLADSIEAPTVNFGKLNKSAKGAGGGMKDAAEDAKETASILQEVNSELDAIQESYTRLEKIQEEYNKSGKLTIDQAQEISQMDLRYLANLKVEANQLQINTQGYEGLARAKVEELKIAMMRNAIDVISSIKTEADATAYLANSNLKLATTTYALTEAEYTEALAHLTAAGGKRAEAAATIQLAMANALAMMENIDFSNLTTQLEGAGHDMGNAMGDGMAKEMEDSFEEVIDWIERKIEMLDKELELLEAKYENKSVRSMTARNKVLNKEIKIRKKELKTYKSAVNYYKQQFNSAIAGLDKDIVEKIKNGAIDVTTITDENLSKAINKAKDFYDKMKDAKIQVQKMNKEIAQLAKKKFDNLVEAFNIQVDRKEFKSDLIEAYKDLAETKGEYISSGFYESLSTVAAEEERILEEKRQKLIASLRSSIDTGKIKIGSEEYVEMQNEINDVTKAIVEARKQQEEWNNSIIEAKTELFNIKQEILDNSGSELSDVIDLFDTDSLYDDDNNITDEGLAKLGLYAKQYTLYTEQAKQYAQQMDEIENYYRSGQITAKEYNEQISEIASKQRESAKSANSAKQSMIDLTKTGIEDQKKKLDELSDSYSDLISSMKEALDAEKDLHDYEKSIEQSKKDINKVKRQLAAIQNDNSASAVAKRKKLQAQLADYEEDLKEKQYDHSIQMQKKALDEELDNYKSKLEKQTDELDTQLKEQRLLFEKAMTLVGEYSGKIAITVAETVQNSHMNVSSAVTGAWGVMKQSMDEYYDAILRRQAEMSQAIQTEGQASQETAQQAVAQQTQEVKMSDRVAKQKQYEAALKEWEKYESYIEYGRQERKKYAKGSKNYNTHNNKIQNAKAKQKQVETTLQQLEKELGYAGTLRGATLELTKDGKIKKPKGYATGVHSLKKDEWAWTQEKGGEAILSPTRNAVFTPLRAGDSVLTAKQTDNLFKYAKMDINTLLSKFTSNKVTPVPAVNNQSTNSLHIENLVTVNGSINEDNLKKMQETAKNAINEAFKKFRDGLH